MFRQTITLYRKHTQESSMKKRELVVAMADELDMSKLQTTSVLKTILETMTNSLVRGESIELRDFGSFVIRQYDTYEGRNPKTGKKVQVKPKKLPHFKVGKELRLRVNRW
jgi:integration host factor subunit beta